MKTMPVTKFKAHALQVVSEVAETYETVVITKRGKPFVEVISFRSPGRKAIPGKLAHTLVSESDIVSPLGAAQWDAAR
ncbi:MAG: type II toxin-antitoxin system Phd/YefM family antitoxin [Elusimicrobia bacterium]|nr:type II toxin-antitoxin system Phd/YefM family antitoxin [Elusimicrobiota bacterium]